MLTNADNLTMHFYKTRTSGTMDSSHKRYKPSNPRNLALSPTKKSRIESHESHVATPESLIDKPGDQSISQAADHVMQLKAKRSNGSAVKISELQGYSKLTCASQAKLLIDREVFEKGVLPTIESAKDSIHIASLYFEDDFVGDEITDRLIAKKRSSPDIAIRVIADGFNQLQNPFHTPKNIQRLKNNGIEVFLHSPITNLSLEHRKLVIADGERAVFGGWCFHDDYYATPRYMELYRNAVSKGGEHVERFLNEKYGPKYKEYWQSTQFSSKSPKKPPKPPTESVTEHMKHPAAHDSMVQVQGPIVRHLQAGFLQSWLHQGGQLDPDAEPKVTTSRYFPASSAPGSNSIPAKVTHGIPQGQSQMKRAMFEFIASAKQTLDIQIAYVTVSEFADELSKAANRGVKIRLLSNGADAQDSALCYRELRSYYPKLFASGDVELWETKKYSHLKAMLADERFVFMTTGNPERTSWNKAFDETAVFDSPSLARALKERVFAKDIHPNRATQIFVDDLKKPSLSDQLFTSVTNFFFSKIMR